MAKRTMSSTTTRAGFFATILCLAVLGMTANGVDDALASKCAAVLQKVTTCLPFVTEKAASPSRECCGSVTDLSHTDPTCLCYIILQVHNGSNTAIKSMGVSETRLLQLPSACTVANASISDCPRLLQLPRNSTDAAIFTNVSTISNPISAHGPTSANHGFWSKPSQKLSESIIVSAVIFFVAFPSGLLLLT